MLPSHFDKRTSKTCRTTLESTLIHYKEPNKWLIIGFLVSTDLVECLAELYTLK